MAKINVAVVFGGRSSEHAISCVSAGNVLAAIDRGEYDVTAIGIDAHGRWLLQEADAPLAVTEGQLPRIDAGDEVTISSVPGSAIRRTDRSPLADVDVVFPLLHGAWGEDGTIQGLLELAAIPYVGSGVYASAASMDKVHMKAAFRAAGIDVGTYEVVTDRQWRAEPDMVLARLAAMTFPVFVKPARAGSSVGISKVNHPAALTAAIDTARAHDPKVIIEESIEHAREVECAVLVQLDGLPHASVLGEIRVHADHEFYDFEAKYLDEGADLVVPADLPEALAARVRDLAVRAFEALDCEGLARVDFFLRDDGTVLVNEVNTMPGFTPISMFPRLWAATGIEYPRLIDTLIRDALRRGTGLR